MVKVVGRGEVLGMKKKTPTTSTSNSNSKLYATATNIKTGETKYLVNGKLVDTKPSTPSRSRSMPISNTVISKEGKISITDLNKGLTVTTKTDVSGKEISRAISNS